jgi:hypothetical protein
MAFRPPHPKEVWDQVREAYRSGMTAGDCARIFGVSASRLAGRAAEEGWRRIDEPVAVRAPVSLPVTLAASPPEPVAAPEDDPIAPEDAPRAATQRATRAIASGDPLSALRWVRVAALARTLPGGAEDAEAEAAANAEFEDDRAAVLDIACRLARQDNRKRLNAVLADLARLLPPTDEAQDVMEELRSLGLGLIGFS